MVRKCVQSLVSCNPLFACTSQSMNFLPHINSNMFFAFYKPQSQKRTSIYYQPQASTKDAYEDYTRLVMRRLTTGDNGKPILPNRSSVHQPSTSVRTSIYRAALPTGVQQQQSTKARPMPTSTMKSTPGRVHISQPSKLTGSTKKTPVTVSVTFNSNIAQVTLWC